MQRRKIAVFGGSVALLALTVPWWFGGDQGAVWGVPVWALYSLGATVCYAAGIALLLGRFWDLSAGGPEGGSAGEKERGGAER